MNLTRFSGIVIPLTFSAVLAFAPSPQAALTQNSLTVNGLGTNSLTVNGLSTNALTVNGLGTNALTVNGLGANALVENGVRFNALTHNGMSSNYTGLDELNGVLVEAVILPERFNQ